MISYVQDSASVQSGRIKPGIRIIYKLLIIHSAAVIMGQYNPPHLPKAVNRCLLCYDVTVSTKNNIRNGQLV